MFNQSILNDIRDRVSIVSFIGGRVILKKAGSNFKGLCPFHQEKTPSFIVSEEKQIFHCFGCGEGGDIFKFLMKYEGVSFAEAVSDLAKTAGVEIKDDFLSKKDLPGAEIAKKKNLLYRVNSLVADHFHKELMGNSGEKARNYLKNRGIKNEILTQHFLGYAENSWDRLITFLQENNIPLELASELGLIKKKENASNGKYYDFFRNRIVFPIRSIKGEVIGFSARTLEAKNDNIAKYINSPDSLIYNKSSSLYGIDLAIDDARKINKVILVEGNLDQVALFQSGIKNVVAPLGTSLTIGHVRLLSRFTKNIVLVFDGDEAGKNAATRALPIFIEAGLVACVVSLPKEEDPDTFIRKNGAEELNNLIKNAPTLFEFFVDKVADSLTDSMASKIESLRKVVPVLREVNDVTEKKIYKNYIIKKFKIDESVINSALDKGVRNTKIKVQETVSNKSFKKLAVNKAERLLVETILKFPKGVSTVFENLIPKNFNDEWSRTIAELLYDSFKKEDDININDFLENIADVELAGQVRTIIISETPINEGETRQLIEDCIRVILERPVNDDIKEVNRQIKTAEASGDEKTVFELLAKKLDLISSIKGF